MKRACRRSRPVRISRSIRLAVLPVPAGAKGAGYLSPRVRARMAELQLDAGRSRRHRRKRKRRAGHDQRSGKFSQRTRRTNRRKNRARSAPAWPMRCGAVGRDRSPPWAFPFVSIRCCKIGRSAIRNPALLFMCCARSRSRLAEQPNAAARLIGGRAIRSESIDIGVAVEAQDGIMVPVIRNADKTSLADLTSRYTELVDLARRRRLTSEMTSGGIASVSNFGTFGLDWGTPIPLPDQTLLLGLGAGKKAPSWDEEKQQFVPDDASRTHAELRSSQPRRRRRRALAEANRRAARRSGKSCRARVSAQPRVCGSRTALIHSAR